MAKAHVPQEMSQEQVKNILMFIEATQPDYVKGTIFNQLGHECFYARNLDAWIEKYKNDVQGFLDWVNIQHASKYWESLEFNDERTVLTLTGRKVAGCACAFSDCARPPLSLCHFCCKNFQQELFGMLLGQKVEVKITESFLLGAERCSTTIHLV